MSPENLGQKSLHCLRRFSKRDEKKMVLKDVVK
jgi:hypothetical protein